MLYQWSVCIQWGILRPSLHCFCALAILWDHLPVHKRSTLILFCISYYLGARSVLFYGVEMGEGIRKRKSLKHIRVVFLGLSFATIWLVMADTTFSPLEPRLFLHPLPLPLPLPTHLTQPTHIHLIVCERIKHSIHSVVCERIRHLTLRLETTERIETS